MPHAARFLPLVLLAACSSTAAREEESARDLPTIERHVRDLDARPGFLRTWHDERGGRLWVELREDEGEDTALYGTFLHVDYLAGGIGSNPVGLDRGRLGETRLIEVHRVGGRVLFVQPNLDYRAEGGSAAERAAAETSFARSVLWAGDVAAESEDGRRVLVDLTSFLVSDAHGVARTLDASGEGGFELDRERSAVLFDRCLSFPRNLELQALLTFSGREPGREVRATTPTPESLTVVLHHSFLPLPEAGYERREWDPRTGSFAIGFQDYAVGLDEPIVRRFAVRHRLQKEDGRVVEPIVFYVDSGAPEPVRGALLEGARWWERAFEAAGFPGGYRVELLPEGVHPLDARYNVIQWVHRATRGWSYGRSVTDPRTGEIVKGIVSLGSLRVRQDRLLFEGLLGTEHTGSGRTDDPLELALARIRQLSAHEVGHTLGLSHNFAASTYGRASVMDYPAPLVTLDRDGGLDLSRAYGVGVGEWDLHAIRWLYADVDSDEELDRIAREGIERGLLYLSDSDARPAGASHPAAALWDNGPDPVAGLQESLRVRAVALREFGERNVAEGRPLAELEEVLAPLYFHHRYQLDAALKVVGGLEYTHAVRGDGQSAARPVEGERQRKALQAVLAVLAPQELDLPERVLSLLLPRPPGVRPNREMFDGGTRPAFDGLAAAAAAAEQVVAGLLQTERAARVAELSRRDSRLPTIEEVLDELRRRAFPAASQSAPRLAAIERVVQRVCVDGLVRAAEDPRTAHEVRAACDHALRTLQAELATNRAKRPETLRHNALLVEDIARHFNRRRDDPFTVAPVPAQPPGSPIGADAACGCGVGH